MTLEHSLAQGLALIGKNANAYIEISGAFATPLIELPQLILMNSDSTFYLSSTETRLNRNHYNTVPQKVEEALCNAKRYERFEHEGWMWRRVFTEPTEAPMYMRQKYAPTQAIMEKLKPYLDSLEGLMGRTVHFTEALPPYEQDPMYRRFFRIPGANPPFLLNFKVKEGQIDTEVSIEVSAIAGFGPDLGDGRLLLMHPGIKVARFAYRLPDVGNH